MTDTPKIILRNLRITGVHLVDKGDNPGARVLLLKRQPAQQKDIAKMKTVEEILAGLTPEDRAVVEQAMLALKEPPKMEVVEDGCKPDEMAKRDAEVLSLRKRIDELEDERTWTEMRKRAETMTHLPGLNRDKTASLLKAAKDSMGKVEFETLTEALVSASKVIEKGSLLGEFGSSTTSAGDAKSRVDSIAKSYKEKDPTLSMAKARTMAYEAHPELYREVRGLGEVK